jgi:hypothetical protein
MEQTCKWPAENFRLADSNFKCDSYPFSEIPDRKGRFGKLKKGDEAVYRPGKNTCGDKQNQDENYLFGHVDQFIGESARQSNKYL